MAAMDFEDALGFTLEWEGGVAFLKGDPGGLTNLGVTQATYTAYLVALGQPTKVVTEITVAEMRDLYFRLYWLRARCDLLPGWLGLCVFDTAVHSGPGRASKMLQEALGVVPDGAIGKDTVAAIHATDAVKLLDDFLTIRYRFLVNLSRPGTPQHRFRNGWTNRVTALKHTALKRLQGSLHG